MLSTGNNQLDVAARWILKAGILLQLSVTWYIFDVACVVGNDMMLAKRREDLVDLHIKWIWWVPQPASLTDHAFPFFS